MVYNFEEFVNESNEEYFGIDFSKSPFKNVKELTHKVGKDKGELTNIGKIADFILKNPGLTRKEICQIILDMPRATEEYMYSRGAHNLINQLMRAFKSGYVIRDNSRPMKWYARVDKNETLEEVIERSKTAITSRKFGL